MLTWPGRNSNVTTHSTSAWRSPRLSPCTARRPTAPVPAPQAGRGAAPRVTRPALFFSEEWKQTPANDEHPVTQQSVANPALELKLYGSTAKEIQLTGAPGNENNPIHVWTGMCSTPCALAFRHKDKLRRPHRSRAHPLEHEDIRIP